MREFITADVADLRSDVRSLTNAVVSCKNRQRSPTPMCQTLVQHSHYGDLRRSHESPTPIPPIPQQTVSAPILTFNPTASSAGSRPLPEKGLDIPNLPVRCADGSYAPKKDSWKYIVRHWTEADPGRGLHVALRDWPAEWLRGKNKAIFGSKYHQRAMIALEFLDQ